jgi:hypothetical protein
MDELARTVGARTLVAVAPLSEQVRQLAAEPTPPHPERLMPDGIMHGFGQTTGIPTLLLMPFLVEAERGTPTAYAREFHWTPAGHLAAAEAIAAEIRRRGWLPCP